MWVSRWRLEPIRRPRMLWHPCTHRTRDYTQSTTRQSTCNRSLLEDDTTARHCTVLHCTLLHCTVQRGGCSSSVAYSFPSAKVQPQEGMHGRHAGQDNNHRPQTLNPRLYQGSGITGCPWHTHLDPRHSLHRFPHLSQQWVWQPHVHQVTTAAGAAVEQQKHPCPVVSSNGGKQQENCGRARGMRGREEGDREQSWRA